MIFDAQTQFSKAQAIAGSAPSTNVIDLKAAGIPYGQSAALKRDMRVGAAVPLQIQVVEDFATLTSLVVAVETDDNQGFASPTVVLKTEAIPVAQLKAGYVFNIDALPMKTSEQYVRLNYTVAGANATAGKLTAGVVAASQRNPL